MKPVAERAAVDPQALGLAGQGLGSSAASRHASVTSAPKQACPGILVVPSGRRWNRPRIRTGPNGRWPIAGKVPPDRMISTVDPDTRHAHKTQSRQQDGFKAHMVIEPDTGLITAAELTKASGPENSDAAVGALLIFMDSTIAGTSLDVLADSAYGSP